MESSAFEAECHTSTFQNYLCAVRSTRIDFAQNTKNNRSHELPINTGGQNQMKKPHIHSLSSELTPFSPALNPGTICSPNEE